MPTQPDHDPAFTAAMREMSRAHVADIWRRGQAGEVFTGEDQSFYQAMKVHPEYVEFWERAAELSGKDVTVDGVNPYLHASLHSVIERQIAETGPPETEQAVFRLTHAGLDRHEAVHRIAGLLSEFIYEMMKQKKPFDNALYCRRLRALKP